MVAVPNPAHPPSPEGLRVAAVVLDSIDDLVPEAVRQRLGSVAGERVPCATEEPVQRSQQPARLIE